MREQYVVVENPNEEGVVIKLWKNLGESSRLREAIPEYFKLTNLCLTMILGSVEDETVFSTLGFLKSKVRNKLDKNLDNCLRLCNSRYEVESFPYDRAVSIWRKRCQKRGIANISNPSGSGSGGGSGSGSGDDSGSYPDIESNEDDIEFGIHSESDADSESEENTTKNEMLYAINEEDSDDSDVEPVQAEWQL